MIVWVVLHQYRGETTILGVFFSQEEAELFSENRWYVSIHEMEVQ